MSEQNVFGQAIAALEREAADLENRAAKLRATAAQLREVTGPAPMTLIRATATSTSTASPTVTITPMRVEMVQRHTPTKRTPTSKLILDAIQQHPGIRFPELAEIVIPKIESEATNKRKLVHSTVDYLKGAKKIYFKADGKMFLGEGDA